jgi:hypothetical protein
MIARCLKGTVTEDRRLEVKVPRSVPPGRIDVILIREPPERRRRPRGKPNSNVHPAAGLWSDRKDIGETASFVLNLRRRLERRGDARR